MTVKENLQFSINKTFVVFDSTKRFLGFSLVFLLLSALFAIIISLIAVLFINQFLKGNSYSSLGDIFDSMYQLGLMETMYSVIVFNLGLFALFLFREEKKGFAEKYNITDLFRGITSNEWIRYAIILLILVITRLLIFYIAFNQSSVTSGMDMAPATLFRWLMQVLRLANIFLPYVCAMLFIHRSIRSQKLRPKFVNAYITGFILAVFIHVLTNITNTYINTVVLDLIKIPFEDPTLPIALSIFTYIVIATYFLPAFAAGLAYPFINVSLDIQPPAPGKEDVQPEDDNDLNESQD